ncbi:MAG TPA: cation:proton antiporter [Methylibium sp.]|uniref:cation:proton antiporter n=1 Tax=Methylibium sp. TaxID=2067992 RepID=UPI002DBFEF39|nr:cation:proton antiporter [Methylibium sp.]HEU4458413.1 cation:proton antiporter [Methylibium sp.]
MKRTIRCALLLPALAAATPALGAGPAQSEVHAMELALFFTLMQLAIIVLAARAGGVIAQRFGQATAVGEIITGILLGPSLFGLLAPDLFQWVFRSTSPLPLTIMSQVGLLLLMFQIGLEFDFGHLTEKRHRRAVMWVSAAGLVAPFALGAAFGWFAPAELLGPGSAGQPAERLSFTLFIATAFSITALPILGRILIEFRMTRHPLGVIAISSAAINDVIGWLLLAFVTALSTAAFAPLPFVLRILGVLAFGAVSWWIVRPAFERFVQSQLASRAAGDPGLPATLMGVVIAAIFAAGMTTYQLGIFAIFGGFMMGVLLHRQTEFVKVWNERVGSFVNVFFLPIFFTFTGLRTDIGSLSGGSMWGWCLLLIALATLGKFGACWLAARAAGMDGVQGRIIGVLMNTRALMELIIINVGYDLGILGREVFTMLVLMAIFSTVITSPLLRRWLPQVGDLSAAREPLAPGAAMGRTR